MNRSAEQQQTNPLREGLSTRAVPQPCSIVIFGATGDLTHRKLIPALYNLANDGELPPAAVIIGFARRPTSARSTKTTALGGIACFTWRLVPTSSNRF